MTHEADVSKEAEVKEMIKETLKKFWKIDILINNAGIVMMSPAEAMTNEQWEEVVNVNLKAPCPA